MGKYEDDTRKAAIDLDNFLNREEIPPYHIIVRTFLMRYGFGAAKVKNLIRDAFPQFRVNEEEDRIEKVV